MVARAAELDLLDELDEASRDLLVAAETAPLPWVRWTPPQDSFLRLNPPTGVKLIRAGNQIGKTWALMEEIIWRATGTHPHFPTKAPPVEIWVVCTSWAQSVAIQGKFWYLVDKAQLNSRTRDRYKIEDGWGKDNPVASFLNGSIVRFRTTNQGAEAQAGASVDYVAIDEPPDEEVFRELRKRVTRTGGQIGMSLTPVNRPCGWLRDQVDKGMIDEVHAKLEARNLIPMGQTRPLEVIDPFTRELVPMDQAWVDHQRKITPMKWAPVVLDGEWETVPEGVFFACFDEAKHAVKMKGFDPKRGPIRYVLGIDYATADREFGHVCVLSMVQQYKTAAGRTREAIYALDEVALSGTAADSEFAQHVLRMLDRNNLKWTDLYRIHGDNPVAGHWVEKSNLNTMRALAREMGISYDALTPRIMNAKDAQRSAGSYDTGLRYLYEHIATGDAFVHPRCVVLIKGLNTWDYTKTHPYKDILDGWRYGLKPFIFAQDRADVTIRFN